MEINRIIRDCAKVVALKKRAMHAFLINKTKKNYLSSLGFKFLVLLESEKSA